MLCVPWRGEWSYFNSLSKMKQQYGKSPILIFIYRNILDSIFTEDLKWAECQFYTTLLQCNEFVSNFIIRLPRKKCMYVYTCMCVCVRDRNFNEKDLEKLNYINIHKFINIVWIQSKAWWDILINRIDAGLWKK